MLKRYQILLSDWLAEYAQFVSQEYDLSFSEAVRIIMCIGSIQAIRELEPKYKCHLSVKQMVDIVKKVNGKAREEVTHQRISQAYFEARKAIEFRLAQAKKKKRRNEDK